ncbi:hypothetical protein GQX74_012747 [Glossina fuscipes]|nr:hypothetical protein GQX74_012747 [Glossina fuscipes]
MNLWMNAIFHYKEVKTKEKARSLNCFSKSSLTPPSNMEAVVETLPTALSSHSFSESLEVSSSELCLLDDFLAFLRFFFDTCSSESEDTLWRPFLCPEMEAADCVRFLCANLDDNFKFSLRSSLSSESLSVACFLSSVRVEQEL